MIVDRDLVDGNADDDADDAAACDYQCLRQFYDNLIDSVTTTECYKVDDRAEIMFAVACRNVLSDMEDERRLRPNAGDQRGLLHSIRDEEELMELNNLLRECVDETASAGRLQAVLNLGELLQADFGEVDDDGEDRLGDVDAGVEQDYENENVAHAKDDDKEKDAADDDGDDDDDGEHSEEEEEEEGDQEHQK
jgi:hypothetical protein